MVKFLNFNVLFRWFNTWPKITPLFQQLMQFSRSSWFREIFHRLLVNEAKDTADRLHFSIKDLIQTFDKLLITKTKRELRKNCDKCTWKLLEKSPFFSFIDHDSCRVYFFRRSRDAVNNVQTLECFLNICRQVVPHSTHEKVYKKAWSYFIACL